MDKRLLRGPVYSPVYDLEWTFHEIPPLLYREFKVIFPKAPTIPVPHVVPVFQPATVDLLEFTEEIEKEKDRLLLKFFKWSEAMHKALATEGYWSDYTDPASGFPMKSQRSNMTFNDVASVSMLLPYNRIQAGPCEVVTHPRWGAAVYPTTFFTMAHPEAFIDAAEAVDELGLT